MPKVPQAWSNSSSKNPANWGTSSKQPQAWSDSSVIKEMSPAVSWLGNMKNTGAWAFGFYTYDTTVLNYDSVITYDGLPNPITTKTPANWSTT